MTQQLRVLFAFANDSIWFPEPKWQSGILVPGDLMPPCDILGLLHTCDGHRSTHTSYHACIFAQYLRFKMTGSLLGFGEHRISSLYCLHFFFLAAWISWVLSLPPSPSDVIRSKFSYS